MTENAADNTTRVSAPVLEEFVRDLLRAHGVDDAQSDTVAKILIWSELVGRPNFGLERLPIHLRRVKAGLIHCPANATFTEVAPTIQLLDGDAGFGHHVGALAMERAISLAKDFGIGVVGVRNSNFFGAGSYFVNMAAEHAMIGFALSNSFPKVTAHGGIQPVMGTNPFAFGAPLPDGRRAVLLDMATSAGAGSTIREYMAKGLSLPENIAIDADGIPITDPEKVSSGTMLPFGGAKGYGLALMVEILCGVLTGAGIGQGVGSMYGDFTRESDNGHFMLALDVQRFMTLDAFRGRMSDLVTQVKAAHPDEVILIPGEQRFSEHDANMRDGIEVDQRKKDMLAEFVRPSDLTPPWT